MGNDLIASHTMPYSLCFSFASFPLFVAGELQPGTSTRCPLQLLALVAGLHELRGCTVADMQTAQEFPQGKLRDVLVEFPPGDGDNVPYSTCGESDSDCDEQDNEGERVLVVRGDSVL